MDSTTFTARRITSTYRQTINARPDDVFPLLCPVREAEFLVSVLSRPLREAHVADLGTVEARRRTAPACFDHVLLNLKPRQDVAIIAIYECHHGLLGLNA